jgi:hypothetical protein
MTPNETRLVPRINEVQYDRASKKFHQLWKLFSANDPKIDPLVCLCRVVIALQPGVVKWEAMSEEELAKLSAKSSGIIMPGQGGSQ